MKLWKSKKNSSSCVPGKFASSKNNEDKSTTSASSGIHTYIQIYLRPSPEKKEL